MLSTFVCLSRLRKSPRLCFLRLIFPSWLPTEARIPSEVDRSLATTVYGKHTQIAFVSNDRQIFNSFENSPQMARHNARIFEPRIVLASCHIILSVTQNSQMALTFWILYYERCATWLESRWKTRFCFNFHICFIRVLSIPLLLSLFLHFLNASVSSCPKS